MSLSDRISLFFGYGTRIEVGHTGKIKQFLIGAFALFQIISTANAERNVLKTKSSYPINEKTEILDNQRISESLSRARDGDRTRDLRLGKATYCHCTTRALSFCLACFSQAQVLYYTIKNDLSTGKMKNIKKILILQKK